jgi:hypothetical protein
MKTLQTNISEVRLVYRTKVKASERLQVKCLKDAFDSYPGGNYYCMGDEEIIYRAYVFKIKMHYIIMT